MPSVTAEQRERIAPGKDAPHAPGKCVRFTPTTRMTTWCGKSVELVDTYAQEVPAVLTDGLTPDPRFPTGFKPDERLAEVVAGIRSAAAGDRYAEPAAHIAPYENIAEALAVGAGICKSCLAAITKALGG